MNRSTRWWTVAASGSRAPSARTAHRAAVLVGAGALTLSVLAPPATAGASVVAGVSSELTRAPYLSDLTQSGVQVSWATASQYRGVVEYGPPGACDANTVISASLGNPVTVGSVREYMNDVRLSGLSPNTTYCYRILSAGSLPVDFLGSNPSPEFTTMQPANGTQPFTFDVLGDWGDTTNSGVNDGSVNRNQAAIDAEIAGSGATFAISVGDTAYMGGSQTNYGDLYQTGANVSAVFAPEYWAAPGETIPLMQTDGNHGMNATSLAVWPEDISAAASGGMYSMVSYPSIDGSTAMSYPTTTYAFSTGGVRFYMLEASWGNTNVGTASGGTCGSNCAIYQLDHDAHWTVTSAEYQWLARDLAAHPGGLKFAFFHFPLYSDNATQPNDGYLDNTPASAFSLEQLLHDNGVELAFSGHAHIYQRNVAVPGGVTSYVTGGGGGVAEPVGRCSTTDAYAVGWSYSNGKGSACGAAPVPTSDSQVYNFLRVTVSGSNVTVTPINAAGVSFDQVTYDFEADTATPSVPGALSFAEPSPTVVRLSWQPSTDNVGVSAYDIYRNGLYLATVGPTAKGYVDSPVPKGISFTYTVVARDLAGNAASSAVATSGVSDTSPPSAPGLPAAVILAPTSVSLSWKASTDNVGVYGYKVVRGGYSTALLRSGSTGFVDTNLVPGSSYSYQIQAIDLAGNLSLPSPAVMVAAPADTVPPTAPSGMRATSVTSDSALLGWSPSSDNVGVVAYQVLRDGVKVATVSGVSYLDTGVAPEGHYQYQVVALDAAGNAAPGASLAVATPAVGDIFSDGFEYAGLSQWQTVSAMAAESALVHSGVYAAEAPSSGSPAFAYASLGGLYAETWSQAWVYVVSASTSANLFGLRSSTGASMVNIYLSPTGKLAVRNNVGGVTATSATQVTAGAWHLVTLDVSMTLSGGAITAYLDGAPVAGLALTSQDLGSSPITTLQLGDTSSGRTFDIYFDDVAVAASPLSW
ncbi:MAG: fibronectin type III domain-containing protein [Actinomycetota bacterium]|nr:fibronectin type III domain-containing protein [Actinomycetota bacterium]